MIIAKRLAALMSAGLLLVAALVSCADERKTAAYYIDKSGSVSVNLLYLIAADQKQLYKGIVDTYGGGDWNSVAVEKNGTTYTDIVSEVAKNAAGNSLICEYLHDHVYHLTLSDETEQAVDDRIASLSKVYGGDKALAEKLSSYNADIASLRRYQLLAAKQSALYAYLYGENGTVDLEDDVKTYFEENYAIVTHIYFNIGYKEKDDGTTVSLTDEEIAAKRALADEVYARLLAGEDFNTLKEAYSEDAYESVYYPNGFFVTGDTVFPTEFTQASLAMRVGEFRMTESSGASGNGIHILYRLPMKPELYNSDATVYANIRGIVVADRAQKLMDEYRGLVTENPDVLASFDASYVPELALAEAAS